MTREFNQYVAALALADALQHPITIWRNEGWGCWMYGCALCEDELRDWFPHPSERPGASIRATWRQVFDAAHHHLAAHRHALLSWRASCGELAW
jgi:hypothetical protein